MPWYNNYFLSGDINLEEIKSYKIKNNIKAQSELLIPH